MNEEIMKKVSWPYFSGWLDAVLEVVLTITLNSFSQPSILVGRGTGGLLPTATQTANPTPHTKPVTDPCN